VPGTSRKLRQSLCTTGILLFSDARLYGSWTHRFKRCFELCRFETKRPWLALVEDLSPGVDEIKPVGPARVCGFDAVIKSIQQSGELDAELANAETRNFSALIFVFWAGEDDRFLHIALHLPDVAWVRLKNIERVEADLVAILFVEFIEGRNLPPERRSSIAAKYKHYGLVAPQGCKLHVLRFVERLHFEIRGLRSRSETSRTCATPHGFEGEQEVCRHGHALHDLPKLLRRSVHRVIDIGDKRNPEKKQRDADKE